MLCRSGLQKIRGFCSSSASKLSLPPWSPREPGCPPLWPQGLEPFSSVWQAAWLRYIPLGQSAHHHHHHQASGDLLRGGRDGSSLQGCLGFTWGWQHHRPPSWGDRRGRGRSAQSPSPRPMHASTPSFFSISALEASNYVISRLPCAFLGVAKKAKTLAGGRSSMFAAGK